MIEDIYKKFQERLKLVRNLPDHKVSHDYRAECYDKYKHLLPCDFYKFSSIEDNNELQDLLLAHQLFFYTPLKERLENGAFKGRYNTRDLDLLLSTPISKGLIGKELTISQQGLDFVKEFVRDLIYQTKVKGKYPNPSKNLDDVRAYHRCLCMVFILNEGQYTYSISKIAGVMQLTGSVQVVSNFRPVSAAAVFQRYGVDPNPNQKEINIIVPSEGFLGRTLASYYLAKHNPDKIINYYTIDPNEALREPFNEMVKFLKSYGGIFGRVTNWNPQMFFHGSEVPQAKLKDIFNVEFDLTFTSPPYGFTELYISSAELVLTDTDDFNLNKEALQDKLNPQHHKKVRMVSSELGDLKVGDTYQHDGKPYKVLKVIQDTQSHSIGKTNEVWNEYFFRPTVQVMRHNLKSGGYQVWNVGNTRPHPTLEADVQRICTEEGLILEDTLNYALCRRPGSKNKPRGEPTFVFRKP